MQIFLGRIRSYPPLVLAAILDTLRLWDYKKFKCWVWHKISNNREFAALEVSTKSVLSLVYLGGNLALPSVFFANHNFSITDRALRFHGFSNCIWWSFWLNWGGIGGIGAFLAIPPNKENVILLSKLKICIVNSENSINPTDLKF